MRMEDFDFSAVVLANGDFPVHAVPQTVMRRAARLVCCDGAAVPALAAGLQPERVIGDGDSLPQPICEQLGNRFLHVEEQDYNDLTKATRYLLDTGCGPRIAYLGTTGKREDHTLGNISLMVYYARQFGVDPTLITDHGYFVVKKGNQTIAAVPGQQVSIFNVDCRALRSQGLKWETRPFDMLWQGTLNESVAETIRIDADGYYMVFRAFEDGEK